MQEKSEAIKTEVKLEAKKLDDTIEISDDSVDMVEANGSVDGTPNRTCDDEEKTDGSAGL